MNNSVSLPSMFIKCGQPERLYRPLICFSFYGDVDYQGRVQVPWAALSMDPWEMMSGCFELSSLTTKGNEDYQKGSLYNHFILCVDFVIQSTRFGSHPVTLVYNADDVSFRNRALGDAVDTPDPHAQGCPVSSLTYRMGRRHSALQSMLQWFCFNKKYTLRSESAWDHIVAFTGLSNPTFSDVEKAVVSTSHFLKGTARYSQAVALSMAYRLGCQGRPANFKGKGS